MPLARGNAPGIVSANIREMRKSGYPQAQAVAASLSNARRHPKASGGGIARYEGGGDVGSEDEDRRERRGDRDDDGGGGGDVRDQQSGRGGLAAFENAGDWGRAMLNTPGTGPLSLAKDFMTGTGWAGNYNPDFLTVDDMNAGLGHTSKAAGIAEEKAGIAPPGYDDDENAQIAREVMDAYGGEGPAVGGGNAEARGGMEKEKRGGTVGKRAPGGDVDPRLAPDLPPVQAAGAPDEGKSGFLNSHVAGRTDHLHVTLPAGSYVVPADVVSGIGQGNSLAGAHVLHEMFAPTPGAPPARARGGATPAPKPVPILAAGGEFVVDPSALARVFGSVAKGHKAMDAWVIQERRKIVKTMSKLPGPAKS